VITVGDGDDGKQQQKKIHGAHTGQGTGDMGEERVRERRRRVKEGMVPEPYF
jgi:hypothetical protein